MTCRDALAVCFALLVGGLGVTDAAQGAETLAEMRARLAVRLGQVPCLGSLREAVFLGYNAVFVPSGSLWQLSTSDAIPELAVRRKPDLLKNLALQVREAEAYHLNTYAIILTTKKFPRW